MLLAEAAVSAGHPAVAALFGLGAAGLAAAVVGMAWNVHTRQIRLAEHLARRQFIVTPPSAGDQPAGVATAAEEPKRLNGKGPTTPVVIDGPDTVFTGEQARYRVQPAGVHKVVAWAVGGGSVSQAPDPSHPDELMMVVDQPGTLTVIVRVRDGMAERRGTKTVTAVPDVTPSPPITLRLFLHGWGLIAIAVLVAGFAAALDALGNLTSSDFIALVVPLVALLAVAATAWGKQDTPGRHGNGRSALPENTGWPDEIQIPGRPQAHAGTATPLNHKPPASRSA
jgi:hypothetical protein